MKPVKALVERMAELLGADTVTLAAPVTFVALHVAKEAFTPGPNLVLGDLVEADFAGYAELHAASAATQVFVDPATSEVVIQVREPAGGWFWESSGAVDPAMTMFGVYLTDAAGTTLHGAQRFSDLGLPNPVLNAAGQGFSWPQATFRLPVVPMS